MNLSKRQKRSIERVIRKKIEKMQRLRAFLHKGLAVKYPYMKPLEVIILLKVINEWGNEECYMICLGWISRSCDMDKFRKDREDNYLMTVEYAGYEIEVYKIKDSFYDYYEAVLYYDDIER